MDWWVEEGEEEEEDAEYGCWACEEPAGQGDESGASIL